MLSLIHFWKFLRGNDKLLSIIKIFGFVVLLGNLLEPNFLETIKHV